MTAPRILAIDPSLTSTGVCLPDGSCLTIKSSYKGWDRIDKIVRWACATRLRDLKVDIVVIEECIVGRAVHVESMWLHGSLREACWQARVPYVDVHPARRQKYACGDQKIRDKDAVQHRAWKGGSPATNNDEADAWWLHRMATVAYMDSADVADQCPLTDYRMEVLAAIDWPEVNGHKPVWTAPKKPRKPKAAA